MAGNTLIGLLSYENDVFTTYAFWSSVLIIKMLLMSILTGMQRFRTNTFANQEDLTDPKLKVKFDNEKVERVRRAHRNDLENIIPLIIIGFAYVLTNPDTWLAIQLFRAAAIGRLVHTFVYAIYVLPQPSRALGWAVPFFISIYMSVKVMLTFM